MKIVSQSDRKILKITAGELANEESANQRELLAIKREASTGPDYYLGKDRHLYDRSGYLVFEDRTFRNVSEAEKFLMSATVKEEVTHDFSELLEDEGSRIEASGRRILRLALVNPNDPMAQMSQNLSSHLDQFRNNLLRTLNANVGEALQKAMNTSFEELGISIQKLIHDQAGRAATPTMPNPAALTPGQV